MTSKDTAKIIMPFFKTQYDRSMLITYTQYSHIHTKKITNCF